MIGLEYILDRQNMTQQQLADLVDRKKQNVNAWLKGRQAISKKILPILSQHFGVPEEYFSKELTEKDKADIDVLLIKNDIDKNSPEYTTAAYNEDNQRWEEYSFRDENPYMIIELERRKSLANLVGLMDNIRDAIVPNSDVYDENKIGTWDMQKWMVDLDDNIEIFNRFLQVFKTLDAGTIKETLQILEKLAEIKQRGGE